MRGLLALREAGTVCAALGAQRHPWPEKDEERAREGGGGRGSRQFCAPPLPRSEVRRGEPASPPTRGSAAAAGRERAEGYEGLLPARRGNRREGAVPVACLCLQEQRGNCGEFWGCLQKGRWLGLDRGGGREERVSGVGKEALCVSVLWGEERLRVCGRGRGWWRFVMGFEAARRVCAPGVGVWNLPSLDFGVLKEKERVCCAPVVEHWKRFVFERLGSLRRSWLGLAR